MTEAIGATELVKRYGRWPRASRGRPALDGLELRVPAGGITGLLGPNGAGKSTTVKLLLGLARATGGELAVLGHDPWREAPAVRGRTAYVPEDRGAFAWMRAARFIEGAAALAPRWDAALAGRLVKRWEIDGRKRLRELSSGTRSRLFLLAALARRAELLVLDEPTTGLDPLTSDDALSELAGAAADGATILLVTHRLDEVERICDRVVMMSEGRAVLSADLDDLRGEWRAIDVAGHPAPERMRTWEEVESIAPAGEHTRLLVRGGADAVVERARLVGAEVTGVRSLSLREIYLTVTKGSESDAARDDLA